MSTHDKDEDPWASGGGGDKPAVEEKQKVPETDLTISTTVLEKMANEENAEKAWTKKSTYDYESFAHDAPPPTDINLLYAEAPRFEWKEEYGEVAPRDKELEEMIFGITAPYAHIVSGNFQGIGSIEISWYNTLEWDPPKLSRFDQMALHPVVMENLRLSGYEIPTPIQRACIPTILRGNDLIACAQTGSGKTAAFLIPIISKLMGKIKTLAAPRTQGRFGRKAEPLVLIVAPTRELATQIFMECRKFCYRSFMRPCLVYGGADIRPQRNELEKGCDLVVGTPGRLQDFIDRGNISLKRVRFTVIDEADEMLDMGFEPQLRKLLHSGDHNEDEDLQVLMFSATFPGSVRKLAKEFLADDYIRVNVGRIGSVNPNVVQRIIYASYDKKRQALFDLLASSPAARTLIFVNSKREADSLDDFLWNMGLPTTSIHGDRTQREREDALIAFRVGKCPIMIATDVASRGLDVRNILHVINYDMPKTIEEYVHRIGRTARIGTMGLATTFWNDRDGEGLAEALVKTLIEMGQEIPTFLERFKPGDEDDLKFKDEGSDEETGGDEMGGSGGGGGDEAGWDGGDTQPAAETSSGW
ncbi:hypothetical protein H072_8914 [Dactylellina haptotyla CBS 200.50]|uniref:RNA helicase n=1 Tax=Dactylellina haptotyla (strain CBS 200.50) TaxID=1284197 RepID=S8BDV2_DACHA|nr:hypothetical protein H072_8914 [Dactylellina haptotyla CBS 200.50]